MSFLVIVLATGNFNIILYSDFSMCFIWHLKQGAKPKSSLWIYYLSFSFQVNTLKTIFCGTNRKTCHPKSSLLHMETCKATFFFPPPEHHSCVPPLIAHSFFLFYFLCVVKPFVATLCLTSSSLRQQDAALLKQEETSDKQWENYWDWK